jgi:large subunit ribosomal protein L31
VGRSTVKKSTVTGQLLLINNKLQEISKMKTEIHPAYKAIKVVCSCGNAFDTRSTTSKDEIHTDVCSSCHPFYTGKQKIMDTAGRVEKFKSRYGSFKR